VTYETSRTITEKINRGDLSEKPGWVRLSLHPTMTNDELVFIVDAIRQIAINHKDWAEDYTYHKHTNEFRFKHEFTPEIAVDDWFKINF
jgi:hypothetical protein